MLHISRKFFIVPFEQVYFGDSARNGRYEAKIIRYTHRLKPSRQLQQFETVHLPLRREENEMFEELPPPTKEILVNSKNEEFKVAMSSNPSDEEINEFQYFHNQLARVKNVARVNRFQLQTLRLLRDKKALFITKMENTNGEPLCYRVYIVDGKSALLHSVSSTGSINVENDESHFNDSAVICLCWENIKMFNKLGYKTYDFGGSSESHAIFSINERFGGNIVKVYSGYVAKSKLSKKIVLIDEWRKRKFKTI